jgi:hypothetical protein
MIGIRKDVDIEKLLLKLGYINEKKEIFSPLLKKYLDSNLEKI